MEANEKRLLKAAMLAGSILMENGAETYRVEDTVERILSLDKNSDYQVLALITGIIINLKVSGDDYITSMKRIKVRTINLEVIDRVNTISRKLSAGQIDIDRAAELLEDLSAVKNENKASYIYLLLMGFGFTLMSGGNFLEAFVGALAACSVKFSSYIMRGKVSGSFMPSFTHAFTITICLVFFVYLIPILRLEKMAIGSLIQLFPGTVLTNGIRDTMKGDYLTAAGNLLSALSSAIALASGTAMALFITGRTFA